MSLSFHAISHQAGSELDGIHLLWSPPYPTGHALEGFTIRRRDSTRQTKPHCFTLSLVDLDRARRQGTLRTADALVWATPRDLEDPDGGPWFIRLDLIRRHHVIQLSCAHGLAGFAARDDGKVVDGRSFVAGACELTGAAIATVWVVVRTLGTPLQLCGDVQTGDRWEGAKVIVTGLQMPFRAVNPAVGSLSDEQDLAAQLAQPETIAGDFTDLSRHANVALSRPFEQAAWRVAVNDPVAEDGAWDSTPFGLVTAAGAASPAWRRALAFGFLDRDELVPGGVYDYRISGLVPRADRDERRVDFHTVPDGYDLPQFFRMGDILVFVSPAPRVETERSSSGPPNALRKMVRFESLWLIFPAPTSRIVIDGDSDGRLEITALLDGTMVTTLDEPLTLRTELDFGAPANEVILKGGGALVGVVARPIDPGLDPREPVEIAETIHGIAFVPTPPPPSPSGVEVDNLGSAARAARRGQRDDQPGFEISWDPPPRMDPGLMDWFPPDAMSAPPTDVAGHRLERGWEGQPFAGAPGTDGLHFASRNAYPVTDSPRPGFDLLRAFPPADRLGIAPEARVRAIEVFEDEAQPGFGAFVTYRVAAIDAIGRSSTPALSSPTQLQKLTRPPAPIAPPPPPEGTFPPDLPLLSGPNGVQVRLLQASDPDLTDAERARVEADGDLVIIRWGWGPDERALDSHVTEFRIYEHSGRLIEIEAEVNGAPAPAGGGGWSLPCRFSRPLAASEMVGRQILLGDPFVIAAHPAGIAITLTVVPLNPTTTGAPEAGSFALSRITGADEDPAYWDQRVRVVPRPGDPADPSALEAYEESLPASWISVAPDAPRQHRAFGVSAADDEDYIADRRAAVESAPRPGNEGPVGRAEVTARFRGRPDLSLADLAPVDSLVARRASAHTVFLPFTPSAFAPPGADVRAWMRLERCPASAVLPRIVVAPGGISLRGSDGSLTPWPLSTSDEETLRSEHAARAISDRFLAHAAARLDDLTSRFEKIGDLDPSREVRDEVPNTPGRWVYRLRAIDAGGNVSLNGQVLAVVIRVPAPVRAVAPELVSLTVEAETATVTLLDRGGGSAALFAVHSNDPRLGVARAELATIRNRPDLTPSDALVVRDDRGQRLSLTPVTPGAGGSAEVTFPAPDGHRFHVWAVAVSADGIPSRLVGPLHAVSGIPTEVE